MSIQVVTREHYTLICEMFNAVQSLVKIISPFIGMDMAQLLFDNMALNSSLEINIITRFYREDFIKGVSNIDALLKLQNAGVKIYALKGLHTKLYLFDIHKALLGSANFTSGGFMLNHELSLCIENENELNPQLNSYFDELLYEIILFGDYLLTADKIINEKRLIESIIKKRIDKNIEYKKIKFGASITLSKQTSDADQSDTIQDILFANIRREELADEFIIMKLSNSSDNQGYIYDGAKTMQVYLADQKIRGYTWFSTNALYAGMAYKKAKKFNEAIKNGKKVLILFVISKMSNGTNEISYKANVLEVRSFRQPETLPTNDYPDLWHGEKATIWLKIENLQHENVLKTSMFKFSESGEDLHGVITGKNQFSFGYITYI